ncbi:Integrin beta-3 [Eumeta japonica]|uniref:Integrin beta n=1 Tax=Eumeta variegata TaxID=151549 RepID=A0A4C1V5Y9_EUMVA|nr:Integrin beta-3 [Eumeta japonica]
MADVTVADVKVTDVKVIDVKVTTFKTIYVEVTAVQAIDVKVANDKTTDDKVYNHKGPRCESKENTTNWCNGQVYDPPTVTSFENRIEKNQNSTQAQLSPQTIKITTRPGVSVSFNISYTPIEDYPLDVYYLIDTSYTMKRYTKTLKQHSQLLQKLLSNFTNNVKLGIGSFVEKPAMPYSMPFHEAYSFRNDLTLTKNPDSFKDGIERISFGSNWDIPEATFDALMQAMVCTELIGWRNISRRIIVVCTDSVYHSAGDGLMAGAYKRNDMKCHMKDNEYTEASTMDYPSVGEISKVAKDESIKIIFAATKEAQADYERLQSKIYGSIYHVLGEETKNIAEYIKNSYVDLTQNLRLDTTNVPDYVQLSLNPPCDLNDFHNCKVKYRETKNINVQLLVKYCPKDKRVQDVLEIKLMGLKEKIVIELQLHCVCECEKEVNTISNATQCNAKGKYQCGICNCNENRCGKCIDCGSRYSGRFCESDDESCPRVRGVMCAGNGQCSGGICECSDPSQWTGQDCACPVSDVGCIAPQSEKVCSGNGKCVCGECVCDDTTTRNYTDTFCDYCDGCAQRRCEEINAYAACAYNESCNTTDTDVTFLDEKEMSSSAWELAKSCSAPLEELCTLSYKYKYNKYTKRLQLILQKQKVCVTPLDYKIPLLSTIAAVLAVGLLSALLWKVLVDLHDAKEYRRFEEQFNAVNWNENGNPLYRSPDTTFSNPVFKGDR